MIDEYLNYIQEETFEPADAEKSKTVKNSTRIRKKGNRQEVEIDADLGSIQASIGTKDLDEALIGDEDDVEYSLDVSAGIIMKIDENNREQVLLIQRAKDDHWPNVWEFPRGKCDKPVGESLFHCAAREIKEETGLDIIPKDRIDTYEYLADHGKRKTICHVFLCKMKDPNQKIKLSKEHQDYQWVGEVGEVEMMLMPDQKKVLQKFLNRDRAIVSYPDNGKMQQVEEYLNRIQ
ncbi:MAG: NUDIX hydrolase [Candidatus Heimdallarchaeaceae archaeon]